MNLLFHFYGKFFMILLCDNKFKVIKTWGPRWMSLANQDINGDLYAGFENRIKKIRDGIYYAEGNLF